MATYTIELPDTLTATSRKVDLTVKTSDIPLAIMQSMIPHSFQQLLGDAAASAGKAAWEIAHAGKDYDPKIVEHKHWCTANPTLVTGQVQPLMQKRLDALLSGEWTVRASGEGLSSVRSVAVTRLFKALLEADDLKRFNKLSGSDQVRKALEQSDLFTVDAIAAEVAKIEAERQAREDDANARRESVAELKGKMKITF